MSCIKEYHFNGNLESEKYMNKDIKDEGIWKFYDEDGTLIKEEEYHNDKLIKTKQYKDDITHEMHNDYCAARASVLGAEYALKEMT